MKQLLYIARHMLVVAAILSAAQLQAQVQTWFFDDFNTGLDTVNKWKVENLGIGSNTWTHVQNYQGIASQTLNGTPFVNVTWVGTNSGAVFHERLTTSAFNTTSAPLVLLKFEHFYKDYVATTDTGYVEVFNGTNWVVVASYFGRDYGGWGNPESPTIDITAHKNDSMRVRFRYMSAWDEHWSIDNVKIFTPANIDLSPIALVNPPLISCYGANQPVSVRIKNEGTQVVNFTTNNATITVNATVGTTNLSTSVVMNTGTLAAGAEMVVNAGTIDMSTAGTYNFVAYIKTVGDNEVSNDTLSAIQPRTSAGTGVSLPYVEDFSNTGLLTNTWTVQQVSGTGGWTIKQSPIFFGSSLFGTGIPTNYGNNALFFNSYDFSIGTKSRAILPCTDFSAAIAPQLEFWLMQSSNYLNRTDTLYIQASTDGGATWQTIQTIRPQDPSLTTTPVWVKKNISLTAYAGQSNVRLALLARSGFWHNIAIDRIVIKEPSAIDITPVALQKPTAIGCFGDNESVIVRVKNTGSQNIDFANNPTTITVNATVSGTTNSITATINTGSLAVNAENDFSIGTLNMATIGTYSFTAFAKTIGDGDATNDTLKNISNRTKLPYITLPYAEDFSNAGLLTYSWTLQQLNGTGSWTIKQSPIFFGSSVFGAGIPTNYGNSALFFNGYGFSSGTKSRAISPCINLGGATAVVMEYWLMRSANYLTSQDTLYVQVSTDGGTTWQTIQTIRPQDPSLTTSPIWTKQEINLNSYIATPNLRIAFLARSGGYQHNIAIDRIVIKEPSAIDITLVALQKPTAVGCFEDNEPVIVRVKNTGSQNIDFANNPTTITVNATVSGTTNSITTTINTGSLAVNAENDFSVGTLNMATIGTYSFTAFAKTIGDGDATNDTLKNISNRTKLPYITLPYAEDFSNVNLLTDSWTVQQVSGTGSWTIKQSPIFFGSSVFGAGIPTNYGNNALFFNSYGFSSGTKSRAILPCTDFSAAINPQLEFWLMQSSNYLTETDTLYIQVSTDGGTTWQTIQSIRPQNASLTTIPVWVKKNISLIAYAGQSNIRLALLANSGYRHNIAIDYLRIYDLMPNDIGVTRIVNPNRSCNITGNTTITVTIKNFGSQPQSNFPVVYSINGSNSVVQNVTQTLNPEDTLQVTFNVPANLLLGGIYNISAYTKLANEQLLSNDTAKFSVAKYVTTTPTVNFTGFNGTNIGTIATGWREGRGRPTSANAVQMRNSKWTNGTIAGNTTAMITLSDSLREWLILPQTKMYSLPQLRMNVAKIGTASSRDTVYVMASSNCGTTWTKALTLTADSLNTWTSTLTSKSYSLAAVANQDLTLAIYVASKDSAGVGNGTTLHIDDVRIVNNAEFDLAIIELISPTQANFNVVSTQNIVARIQNVGSQPISATSQANILARIIEPFGTFFDIPAPIFASGDQSVLQSGETKLVTITPYQPFNTGLHTICGIINFAADQDPKNDTLCVKLNATPTSIATRQGNAVDVAVFPNPNDGNFNVVIETQQPNNYTVLTLLDISGKIAYQQNITGNKQHEVNVKQLPKGVYILQVKTEQTITTKRVVIQ